MLKNWIDSEIMENIDELESVLLSLKRYGEPDMAVAVDPDLLTELIRLAKLGLIFNSPINQLPV